MVKLISKEQLEQKHGGTAPNRQVGEYWPPRLHSTNFGENEIDLSVLSTKEDDLLRLSVLSSADGKSTSENTSVPESVEVEQ